ncbi:interferon lambda-3-like [Pleurodeles waltl]|uniref:interferon lambda-3-like n=1 Tax=Pleurodeles waltl TaxID=8319 RepID=UPI003709AF6A
MAGQDHSRGEESRKKRDEDPNPSLHREMDPKILILAMAALTMLATEAFPRKAPRGTCHLSQYQTVLPSHLRATQDLRNKHEETMQTNVWKCSRKIFQQRPSVFHFKGHDRLVFVEKKVSLAVRVLENITNPELFEYVSKPLQMLGDIRRSLGHCVNSRAHENRPSQHLDTWLKEFNKIKDMESQECLEKTVILNLMQMLNEDIKCAAHMDQCDKMVQHLYPSQVLTTANQKQE